MGLESVCIGEKEVLTFRDMPPSLYHALVKTSERYPKKAAIIDNEGKTYSYKTWLEMVDCFAACLHLSYGIKKGDHVGLILYNSIEFCIAFLALVKLGAVTISLPSKYKKNEVLSLAQKAQISYVICDEDFYAWFADSEMGKLVRIKSENKGTGYGFAALTGAIAREASVEAQGALSDPAIIMFTSGTTSQSKGVLLKNYNIMHSVIAYQRTLGLTYRDVSVIAVPIYHVTGMIALLGEFLFIGGTLHLHKKVDAVRMLSCVRDEGLTFIHASPTVFAMLLEKRELFPSLPTLTSFACGSSNMAPENIRRIHDWLPQVKFHTIYGMTETSAAGTVFPGGAADSIHIGSSGIPMPNLEILIVDDDGNPLSVGQVGEILLRGSFILEHYYNTVNEAILPSGWLKTGDLGYVDQGGYLYVVDRKKDMINRGGEKICTFDVENELHQLPGIIEAAVVGIPDQIYVEIPVAVVRAESWSEWTDAAIQDALKSKLAKFKIPTRILFLHEIPKTANGKIDKRAIKTLFAIFAEK